MGTISRTRRRLCSTAVRYVSVLLHFPQNLELMIVGVYKIANHKRAVVLCCLRHIQRRNKGQPSPLAIIFFRVLCEGRSACFRGKLKNPSPPPPPHILVLKITRCGTWLTEGWYCLPKRKLRISSICICICKTCSWWSFKSFSNFLQERNLSLFCKLL